MSGNEQALTAERDSETRARALDREARRKALRDEMRKWLDGTRVSSPPTGLMVIVPRVLWLRVLDELEADGN